jgi:hypothetical protein
VFYNILAKYFGMVMILEGDKFEPVLLLSAFGLFSCKVCGDGGLVDSFWVDSYSKDLFLVFVLKGVLSAFASPFCGRFGPL